MENITPFTFYLGLAVILLAAELVIFQLSVFWFLFVGIGAFIAAILALVVPGISWFVATAVFFIASTITCVGLYRPLKTWQNKASDMPGNDAIGKPIDIIADISPTAPGKALWSGTEWNAYLDESETETIKAGETAYISRLEGIRLTVKKASPEKDKV